LKKNKINFGILVFPGTNCEYDCQHVFEKILHIKSTFIWHKEETLDDFDAVIIPGGFSYGDYLRSGAVAKFSPIMESVKKYALNGGILIGICNGFQILLEQNLLPGAMLRNNTLKFICRYVHLKVENNNTCFSSVYEKNQVISMPIRHNEGNYYINESGYAKLEENNQIVLRYCDKEGDVSDQSNPNGSRANIAGICNKEKNIFGLMPHPEACCEKILGSDDGLGVFQSMINNITIQFGKYGS
jgi:phosphoribosylformylglycinamidine synthase subunit PurQ / glutaminase